MFFHFPDSLKQKRFNFEFVNSAYAPNYLTKKYGNSLLEKISIKSNECVTDVEFHLVSIKYEKMIMETFSFTKQMSEFQKNYIILCQYFDLLQILYLLSHKETSTENVIFPFPKIAYSSDENGSTFFILYSIFEKEKEDIDIKTEISETFKDEIMANFCYLFLLFDLFPEKFFHITIQEEAKNGEKKPYIFLFPFFKSFSQGSKIPTFDAFSEAMKNNFDYSISDTDLLDKMKNEKPFIRNFKLLFYEEVKNIEKINTFDFLEKKNLKQALFCMIGQNANADPYYNQFLSSIDFLKDDINHKKKEVIRFLTSFYYLYPKLDKNNESTIESKCKNLIREKIDDSLDKAIKFGYNVLNGKDPQKYSIEKLHEQIIDFEEIIKGFIKDDKIKEDIIYDSIFIYGNIYLKLGKMCLEESNREHFKEIGFNEIERFFAISALSNFSSEAFLELANLYKPDLQRWMYIKQPEIYKSDTTKYILNLNLSAILKNQTAVDAGAKYYIKKNLYSNADFIISWINLSDHLNSAILTRNVIFFYFNDLRSPATSFVYANINVNQIRYKFFPFLKKEEKEDFDMDKVTKFLYIIYKSRIQTADIFLKVFDIYEYKVKFFDTKDASSALDTYMLTLQCYGTSHNIIHMSNEIINSLDNIIEPTKGKPPEKNEEDIYLYDLLKDNITEIMKKPEFQELTLAAERAKCELDLLKICGTYSNINKSSINEPSNESFSKDVTIFSRLNKLLTKLQYVPAAVPLALIHFKIFNLKPTENSRNQLNDSLITNDNIEFIISLSDKQKIMECTSYSNEYLLIAINNKLLKNYRHISNFLKTLCDKVSPNIRLMFQE